MIEANHLAVTASASATLLAESNHRIANNLAVVAGYLTLQANRTVREGGPLAPCEVHSILSAASAKIAAAGNLHRMLSISVEGAIDLGEYLERVVLGAMDAMTHGDRLEPDLQFERGCLVASDQGLNLGLIIGELVINAIKHAHPTGTRGRLEAGCSSDADGIVAWVRDDGVGLPEGFDFVHDVGVGLRTLRLIAHQIGLQLDFLNTELGLAVELSIPQLVVRPREAQVA